MDWKYKHFHQQGPFAATRDVVLSAARAYMSETLGWKITDSLYGITAEGSSFAHNAIADFRFESTAQGTNVIVDLKVERAGGAGFMLFDVGGYYNIQVRTWLDGIQTGVHQTLTGSPQQTLVPPPPARSKTGACLFNGCLGLIFVVFGIWILLTVIFAIVGLATGTLYLFGRKDTIVVHGVWARIISGLILLVTVWIVWRIKSRRP